MRRRSEGRAQQNGGALTEAKRNEAQDFFRCDQIAEDAQNARNTRLEYGLKQRLAPSPDSVPEA
jgi:hypothetical protein